MGLRLVCWNGLIDVFAQSGSALSCSNEEFARYYDKPFGNEEFDPAYDKTIRK